MNRDAGFENLVAGIFDTSLVVASAPKPAERQLIAATVWAAFSCPAAVLPLYDAISEVQLGPGEPRGCAEESTASGRSGTSSGLLLMSLRKRRIRLKPPPTA